MISYIIPYKHKEDRLRNLLNVCKWIKSMDEEIELILVEQDVKMSFGLFGEEQLKLWGIDKYHFIQSDHPFNKSHAMNIGLINSTGDIVCFGDSDLIMNPEEFKECLRDIQNYDMINPYEWVIDLVEEESDGLYTIRQLEDLYNINRLGRGQAEDDIRKVPICGGITMFKREKIFEIGGWIEDFYGWGAEDDAESIKVRKLLNWNQKPYKCYHLYHEPEQPIMQFYMRNLQIFSAISNMTDEHFKVFIEKSVERLKSINNN